MDLVVDGLEVDPSVLGTEDGFLDEDVDFARRLVDAEVPVDLRVHAGLPHGFDVLFPGAASVRAALRDLHDWLGRHLAG